jgi:hypothetical protein
MEVDAATAGAAGGGWDGDVDGAVDRPQELPEDRGGGVAQDGAGAAGEHGGHEAPVEAQAAVADGVDASVDAVETAARNSIPNRSRTQTSGFELPARYRTMLAPGDPRYLRIGRVEFLTHVGT